jgi:molecular chaperone GrpE
MHFLKHSNQSGGAVTGKDEGSAQQGEQPPPPEGDEPAPEGDEPAPEGDEPAPEGDEPAPPAERPEGDVALLLGDLASRLGRVEEQLAQFHRRAAHREAIIDRLHEQNQQLSEGIGRAFLEPVIADLIRLHDQLTREVRRLEQSGHDAQLLWSFADDVVQILDICGVEAFSAEVGDPLERGRHRALAVVACAESSRHNTVAEVVASGFLDRETGRIRRPVQARVFQCPARPRAAGQAPSTAQSL